MCLKIWLYMVLQVNALVGQFLSVDYPTLQSRAESGLQEMATSGSVVAYKNQDLASHCCNGCCLLFGNRLYYISRSCCQFGNRVFLQHLRNQLCFMCRDRVKFFVL